MNLNRFKNIIITLLVFLAMLQTSAIWFEDTGGSFLTLFARNRQVQTDSGLVRNFAFPMRIVTGDGSGDFFVKYMGMAESDLRDFSDGLILSALSSSSDGWAQAPDLELAFSSHIVIYEYAFDMPSNEFIRAFERQQSLAPGIDAFNQILIFPAYNEQGVFLGIDVFFHNRTTGEWAGYRSGGSDGDVLLEEFRAFLSNSYDPANTGIRWASSFLLGLHADPSNNLFIPVWGDGHSYPVGEARPAHFDSSVGAVISAIRANLMSFFDNPAAVYDARGEQPIGHFAWADENTIVRHFPNNVLQFISYRRDSRNTDLLEDFAAALDFMERRDEFLLNDFYLSGFSERNNERIFYFDYILEGLPVIFSDSLRNAVGEQTQHGITVRFRNGNLVSYTRLAYEFRINTEIIESASRDLPLYILNSGLYIESLDGITLAFVAPNIDRLIGVGTMNLWVDFRMWDGMSSIESLN